MNHIASVNRSQLFTAATALSAVGVLMFPAPAQAGPMVPLAPPCDQWAFPGDVVIREAGTGWDVSFSSSGQAVDGRATATGPGGTKSGNISGGMTQGGHVTLTVRYDNGQFQQYVGDVGDDAKLHGVTHNNVPNESGIPWNTVFPISCSKAPLELPIPEEVPDPEQAPPPVKEITMATVEKAVDVYDKPSHEDGKPIMVNGEKLFLAAGDRVSIIAGTECNKKIWCTVTSPKIPTEGNKGAVWGGHLGVPEG